MAKSPTKSSTHLNTKAAKAPGKTILPRHKFQKQRRFSIIDSDSSSELSEFESDDDDEESNKPNHHHQQQQHRPHNQYPHHQFQGNKFHAIESESEDDGSGDDSSDNEGSISANEQLWKNHHKKVVNTSSTSSEGEDDDDDDSNSSSDSSSSDDEDVDFVKLTAERKAKALQHYRSTSPFKDQSPSKDAKLLDEEKSQNGGIENNGNNQDVDFSFNFNNDDHRLRIANEEEEDVGEELNNHSQDYNQLVPTTHGIPGVDELPHPTIESSESDDDIDKDELLRTLEQESDGVEGGGGFGNTNEDEYDLLQQEADNILHDFNNNGDTASLQYSSSNATPRNSVVEEMINKHKSEMNQEEVLQFVSDDDYADDDDDDDYYNDDEYHEDFIVPFFDDTAFKEQLYTNGNVDQSKKHQKELDSDDDSYLWDYFFSSGEENDDEPEDANNNHYSDDEATDEDTTLPPPSSRKKVGAKAQELLSSSSVTARPPALGTWSTDSKPFGIIDGLSTRSLLPNSNKTQSQQQQSSNSSSALNSSFNPSYNNQSIAHTGGGDSLKQTPSTPISNNNIEELTLDELLNMSELEDDDNDEVLNHEDWLEATGSNRKVPLSAFRNKGIVNDDSHINATRKFSPSNPGTGSKKPGKKHGKKINEITMTPIRVVNKQHKQRRKSSKLRRRQSMAEAAVEGLRVTKSGLFSEDTLTNVEEFLSGLGSEAELNLLFREIQ